MHRFFLLSVFGLSLAALSARAGELLGHGCATCKAPCASCKAPCASCKAPCENCGSSTCGEQVMYEEREVTCYKTVFEEVRETKQVPATKFVPKKEYRMVPWTCQTCATGEACAAGEAAAGCGATGCGASCGTCPCNQPTTCLRKVAVEVLQEVPYTKTIETKRMVEKQVPYTIICCTPHRVSCVEGCASSSGPVGTVDAPAVAAPVQAAPTLAPTPMLAPPAK